MKSCAATVRNEFGIHCRPSAVIAQEVRSYPGRITVRTSDGREADPRRLLELISLGIHCGESVSIEVDGPDEDRVCARLVELFETNFDFPR